MELLPKTMFAIMVAIFSPQVHAGILYSNGAPDQASANNLGIALQSDNFSLSLSSTLTEIQFWSLESSGEYRKGLFWAIASDVVSSPGSFVASGFQSTAARAATGVTAFGLAEFTNRFSFNAPVTLGPGNYWLVLHNGQRANVGDPNDFYWETSANNGTVRGMESFDNGASWSTNVNEHAFLLIAADSVTVPEPPTLGITAIGLLTWWGLRRRIN
jgi:hypothetical protein